MKHTKGGWEASKSNSDDTAIGIRSKTALVATVWISKFYNDVPNKEEAEANAELIASAPKLQHKLIISIAKTAQLVEDNIKLKEDKEKLVEALKITNLYISDELEINKDNTSLTYVLLRARYKENKTLLTT